MFQLIISFIYELVRQSWTVSTVLVKYILVLTVLKLVVSDGKPSLNSFFDLLEKYSHEIVSLIVLLGFLNIFTGFFTEPIAKTFSEVVAFLYFLFLFWRY